MRVKNRIAEGLVGARLARPRRATRRSSRALPSALRARRTRRRQAPLIAGLPTQAGSRGPVETRSCPPDRDPHLRSLAVRAPLVLTYSELFDATREREPEVHAEELVELELAVLVSSLLSGKRPSGAPPWVSKPPVFQAKGRARHSRPRLMKFPM